MRQHIAIIFLVLFILSVGCKKAEIAPLVEEQEETNNEMDLVNNSEEETPEVPEEWKGKTIKEILEPIVTQNGTINETKKNTTLNPAYKVEEGTYLIEARKTLSGMVFFPKEIKIQRGETIRWINALEYMDRQAEITIYSYLTGEFRSEQLKYGEYFEHTFDEKGNFTYNALPYQAMFQRGTVTVE